MGLCGSANLEPTPAPAPPPAHAPAKASATVDPAGTPGAVAEELPSARPVSVTRGNSARISKGLSGTNMHKTSSVSSMGSTNSEGTLGMQEILSQESPLRPRFQDFVKSKYAGESLMLYDSCNEYKAMLKNARLSDAEKLEQSSALAQKIVAAHFAPTAEFAVDVPGGLRRVLLDAAEAGRFHPHSFDAVRVLAFNDLKDNFLYQFLKLQGLEDD
jgi:hypothetical protein